MVLGLVADLFFATRIREVARQLEVVVELVKTPVALVERAAVVAPALVIVDMSLRGEDPSDAVRTLKARLGAVPIVGYLFDSDAERIRAARAAGCDRVLSRGGLTQKLPELLRGC